MFTYRKNGGIVFIGLGQVTLSFCVSRKRAAIFQPGDFTKIAAIYVGIMIPLSLALI